MAGGREIDIKGKRQIQKVKKRQIHKVRQIGGQIHRQI